MFIGRVYGITTLKIDTDYFIEGAIFIMVKNIV